MEYSCLQFCRFDVIIKKGDMYYARNKNVRETNRG